MVSETTRPECLRRGECSLPALTADPVRVEDVLRGKDYSKESQVLVRKPYKKCGNCGRCYSPSSNFQAPCSQPGPELEVTGSSIHLFPRVPSSGAQVPSQEAQGGSSVPSTSGNGGISGQGLWLITLTIYSSLHPEENQIPTRSPLPQLSTPSQPIFWVTDMGIEYSQPRSQDGGEDRNLLHSSVNLTSWFWM